MSVCSKHMGNKDPDCTACNVELYFEDEPDIKTCSKCNFVYYVTCDVCPHCRTENIRV